MHPSNSLNWKEVLNCVAISTYDGPRPIAPFWFGNNQDLCKQLTDLVLAGSKTATASLLWEWEDEQGPLPAVGQRDVLLDWNNRFVGIIETKQIEVVPFHLVTPQFAYLEGEGDLSLEFWRKVHWEYFKGACHKLGKPITLQVAVVCQVFNLVYRAGVSNK
jgi:uncharacterized protein YhfF|tara:strand:+ start:109 stop:591 length:483 start_codon:yes stop_codon:yes gene_type:complete